MKISIPLNGSVAAGTAPGFRGLMAAHRRSRRRAVSERGSTLVEFSLVFLLFIVLVVATMELGRGVWLYVTVAHAAREGVRYAQVRGDAATITGITGVVESASIGLDAEKLTVDPTWTSEDRERGSIVQLDVSYPFDLVASSLLGLPSSLRVSSRARKIIAQ